MNPARSAQVSQLANDLACPATMAPARPGRPEPADTAFARGRKRHAKTDKTDCRHLRMLLAEGRLFRLAGEVPPRRRRRMGVWVFVDDLDAHFAQARAAGAKIVSGIRQTGFRAHTAEDLERHRWVFAEARPGQL